MFIKTCCFKLGCINFYDFNLIFTAAHKIPELILDYTEKSVPHVSLNNKRQYNWLVSLKQNLPHSLSLRVKDNFG